MKQTATPVVPTKSALRPLGLSDIRMVGGFWHERRTVNRSATLAHCLHWMERVGWVGNFQVAAEGRSAVDRKGREFADSEVYKLLEALVWATAGECAAASAEPPGFDCEAAIVRLTRQIAAAQAADGYVNTAFGQPGLPERYSDLEWGHELYCHAFLIQAGVARARVTGPDDELVRLAWRAADHICEEFGRGKREGVCGHPVIEMALVELARLTGEQRYLDQAALFVERRGRRSLAPEPFGSAYFSDDIPVRDARVLRGHAVRALYLAAGAVDVAVETGDDALLDAVLEQWKTTVARRTYITGGMGARHADEAFGNDFELPADRAYAETCASVASIMLSWRLLLATGSSHFADLIERTLYNMIAAAVAPDGCAFFYVNTLHKRDRSDHVPAPDAQHPQAVSGLRAPWFAVSCCPPNVARLLASLPTYFATADDDGLQIHQYADFDVDTGLPDGRRIGLSLRTAYPESGSVIVRVLKSDGFPWTLSFRIPQWVNETAELVEPDGRRRQARSGMVSVRRSFAVGDEIRLDLPLRPRFVAADPRVDAVRGTRAVERGPVVMCAESVDLPDGFEVDAIRIDPSASPQERDGRVFVKGELIDHADAPWPYDAGVRPARRQEAEIPLIPYHAWANRGPSTMRIFLPSIE